MDNASFPKAAAEGAGADALQFLGLFFSLAGTLVNIVIAPSGRYLTDRS
jgi:hypothetical protein